MNAVAVFHSVRIKSFPDGSAQVLFADKPVFRQPGWEEVHKKAPAAPQEPPEAVELSQYALERLEKQEAIKAASNLSRAKRRAKNALHDYALSTPMRYFLTLTFAKEKIDRYDVAACVRRFGQWMSNQVKRKGISYVAVAEYHKDGAVHFHALVTDGLPMTDSGTMIPPSGGKPRRPKDDAQRLSWAENGGHTVYNVSGWSYGFSTAIELYGDYHKAVGYVCKYISKADAKIGGRWYYSGGHLGKPDVLWADQDYDLLLSQYPDAYELQCSDLPGVRMAVVNIP